MTEKLREELARIGDTSPRVAVPADVWARGRRARRRDRAVVGAAVLSVVAMLGGLGLVLGLPGREDAPPVSGDDAGAVPSVIHGVPVRLLRNEGPLESWREDVEERDLAVGRASVAFNAGEYQPGPVVITAADGAYHLLELPGWNGSGIGVSMLSGAPLALSPNGRQLAYGWWDPEAPFEGPMPSGVRVLDLETGEIRTIQLEGRDGVLVSALVWSPDSRWIAWQGRMQSNWTVDNVGSRGNSELSGRIPPGSETSESVPIGPRGGYSVIIADDGTVHLVRSDGWMTWDGDGTPQETGVRPGATNVIASEDAAGVVSPSGGAAALRVIEPTLSTVYFGTELDQPAKRRAMVARPLPEGRYEGGALVDPLGWLDEDHLLVRIQPTDADGPGSGFSFAIDDQEIAVMSAPWAPRERYDVVAEVEGTYEDTGGVHNMSVAVDLMTLEQPTRDFPEPEWPWSDERTWGTAALVVVPLVLLALVLRQRRRNSRLA